MQLRIPMDRAAALVKAHFAVLLLPLLAVLLLAAEPALSSRATIAAQAMEDSLSWAGARELLQVRLYVHKVVNIVKTVTLLLPSQVWFC